MKSNICLNAKHNITYKSIGLIAKQQYSIERVCINLVPGPFRIPSVQQIDVPSDHGSLVVVEVDEAKTFDKSLICFASEMNPNTELPNRR